MTQKEPFSKPKSKAGVQELEQMPKSHQPKKVFLQNDSSEQDDELEFSSLNFIPRKPQVSPRFKVENERIIEHQPATTTIRTRRVISTPRRRSILIPLSTDTSHQSDSNNEDDDIREFYQMTSVFQSVRSSKDIPPPPPKQSAAFRQKRLSLPVSY